MKKNIIWTLVTIAVILLFIGAYFLYGKLSESYAPDMLADPVTTTETTDETSDKSADSTDTSDGESEYLAPDFTAVDSDGNEVRLSDYFGKPIVLNFWASWCPPCKEEMPHFEAAYKADPDVQFLMLNMTTSSNETMASAKAHIKDNGYTFPVLYDTKGDAAVTYGASSLPITFFIAANGDLVTYAVGMISADTLDRGIRMIAE